MAQATGLNPRRAYELDANTILVGAVLAGARGRAAETRTGAKRLLTTSLSAQMEYKVVVYGQDASADGGYLIQVAHVAAGGALPADNYAGWVTIAATDAAGVGVTEIALSGAAIHKLAKTAASLTDVTPRPVAVRCVAGTGSNGADVPAGTQTIALVPAD